MGDLDLLQSFTGSGHQKVERSRNRAQSAGGSPTFDPRRLKGIHFERKRSFLPEINLKLLNFDFLKCFLPASKLAKFKA